MNILILLSLESKKLSRIFCVFAFKEIINNITGKQDFREVSYTDYTVFSQTPGLVEFKLI